jgi:hypothetical protein
MRLRQGQNGLCFIVSKKSLSHHTCARSTDFIPLSRSLPGLAFVNNPRRGTPRSSRFGGRSRRALWEMDFCCGGEKAVGGAGWGQATMCVEVAVFGVGDMASGYCCIARTYSCWYEVEDLRL